MQDFIQNALEPYEGAPIDDPAVLETVSAVDGFPYMTQEPRDGVLATTYRELSKGDIRFLEAMLPDQQPSSLADVATRMGVRSNYASKYKERLIDAGVLGDVGQGFYTIDLPGFKDYVREHAGRYPHRKRPAHTTGTVVYHTWKETVRLRTVPPR